METIYRLPDNKTLKIFRDDNPESPRTWDNLTKVILFKNQRGLGDTHSLKQSDYSDWESNKKGVMKAYDVAIIKPVYMYSHSGQTISTTAFSCPWDSWQCGWIIVTKEDLRKEYSIKRVTSKYLQFGEEVLKGEIQVLDQFLGGDVYGFEVLDKDNMCEDSCWGFYGSNIQENGILDNISEEYKEAVLKQL